MGLIETHFIAFRDKDRLPSLFLSSAILILEDDEVKGELE